MRKLFFAAGIAFVLGLPGGASAIDLDTGSSVCFISTLTDRTVCWTRPPVSSPTMGPTVTDIERVNGTDYWVRHFDANGRASSWFGGWARVRSLLVDRPNYFNNHY